MIDTLNTYFCLYHYLTIVLRLEKRPKSAEEKITNNALRYNKAEPNISDSCGEDENMDNILPEVCIS